MPTTEITLELRGGNAEAWAATDPEILVEGPRGTGKSRTLLEKEYAYAQKYPGIRILIVRKTLRSIASSVAQTLRQFVIQNGDGVSFFGGNEIEPAAFRFKNGSAIVLGGLDDPEKLKSSEFMRIYWNEATEGMEDDLESLKALLRQQLPGVTLKRQITCDCNPDASSHWLNQRAEQGRIRRIVTRLEDNPWLFNADGSMTTDGEAYINGILDTYRGAKYERWRKGNWTGTENACYPMFDRAVHIRPLEPGLYFRATILWIDYGGTHKCSVGALSIDQFNRRWIRECWGQPDTDEGVTLKRIVSQFRERYGTTRGRGDPNQRFLNSQMFTNRPDSKKHYVGHTAQAGNGSRLRRVDLAEQLFGTYPGGRVPTMIEEKRRNLPQGPFAEPDSPGVFLVEGAPGIEDLANELEAVHFLIKETESGKTKEVVRLDEDHVAGFEYANEEWEESPVVSFPTSVASPSRSSATIANTTRSRMRRTAVGGEWKMH